jgi:hypothetical protein
MTTYEIEINNETQTFEVEANNKTEARKKAHEYMREVAGMSKREGGYKITKIRKADWEL